MKRLAHDPLHRTDSSRVIIHPDYFNLVSIFGVSAPHLDVEVMHTLVISAMFLSLYTVIFFL